MRCNVVSHQPKNSLHQLHLCWPIVAFLCLILVSGSIVSAQSGRKLNSDESKPSSNPDPDPGNNRTLGPQAFLVITPVPPTPEEHALGGPRPDYGNHVRAGCLKELKRIKGVKVMEDEGLSNYEARELAQIETNTYVIWMEMKWGTRDLAPFRMRYLLLEPGTGKTIATGYGKPNLQRWGLPQLGFSYEEQLREAGRDVASQVMSELGIRP